MTDTSNLAFHLKKLMKESLIAKDEFGYLLTTRGEYFLEIIHFHDKIELSDPCSNVNVYQLPRND